MTSEAGRSRTICTGWGSGRPSLSINAAMGGLEATGWDGRGRLPPSPHPWTNKVAMASAHTVRCMIQVPSWYDRLNEKVYQDFVAVPGPVAAGKADRPEMNRITYRITPVHKGCERNCITGRIVHSLRP